MSFFSRTFFALPLLTSLILSSYAFAQNVTNQTIRTSVTTRPGTPGEQSFGQAFFPWIVGSLTVQETTNTEVTTYDNGQRVETTVRIYRNAETNEHIKTVHSEKTVYADGSYGILITVEYPDGTKEELLNRHIVVVQPIREHNPGEPVITIRGNDEGSTRTDDTGQSESELVETTYGQPRQEPELVETTYGQPRQEPELLDDSALYHLRFDEHIAGAEEELDNILEEMMQGTPAGEVLEVTGNKVNPELRQNADAVAEHMAQNGDLSGEPNSGKGGAEQESVTANPYDRTTR